MTSGKWLERAQAGCPGCRYVQEMARSEDCIREPEHQRTAAKMAEAWNLAIREINKANDGVALLRIALVALTDRTKE